MKLERWQLIQRQGLPLSIKEQYTYHRIKFWYEYFSGEVYVSFSGGKDSTVLLHQVRKLYPEVTAVFVDTGLEYPEIREFVRTIDNVVWLKPKQNFKQIIEKYGYPIISKSQSCAISRYRNTKNPEQKYKRLHGFPNGKRGTISKKWQYLIDAPFKISDKCCDILKKQPLDTYVKQTGKHPMTAMMASESNGRTTQYLSHGCHMFNTKNPISWPMAFWLDEDIWSYIEKYNIQYSKIYNMGCTRTGCMFCMFGVQYDKEPNRFQLMKQTHPKIWKYCMEKLKLKEILQYINIPYE